MLELDVRRLSRWGLLHPGLFVPLEWSSGDESSGNIAVRTEVDGIRLIYTWTPNDGDPKEFDYRVSIERTLCHYGGSRPWFRCPRCYCRRGVIYGIAGDGRFGCRKCMRLGYAGEAEDAMGRLWRKQRKLEAKLGEDRVKPKRMRSRTYERICAKLDEVEDKKDSAFWLCARSVLRRCGMTLDDL